MIHILIIDDDRFLLDSVQKLLSDEKFEVSAASSAVDGLMAISERPPDLLILDVGLPDQDGFNLCRRIRQKWTFPVIMLTSRTDTYDKVIGLEVGADDYLTKPFQARELIARIRAQLRRTTEYAVATEKEDSLEIGELVMKPVSRQVLVRGKQVQLTDLEFRLLEYFMKNPGRALSRDQLFEQVWGYDESFNTNSLEVMVYRLRMKLELPLGQRIIHTIRSYGYRLEIEA